MAWMLEVPVSVELFSDLPWPAQSPTTNWIGANGGDSVSAWAAPAIIVAKEQGSKHHGVRAYTLVSRISLSSSSRVVCTR